jgi:RecA-family ATPase
VKAASLESQALVEAEYADRRLNLWMPDPADRFSLLELRDPPPRMEFVVEPYLPAGCASILTAAGGTSKTGLCALFSIHVCLGREIFGCAVTQGATLHVSAEDRRVVFQRHVYSNTRDLSEHELKRLTERLHVKDTVGLGFKLTRHIDGQTDVAEDIGQLIEYAREIPDLRLITLDTLSRLNGGEENNEDLARFVEAMERISRETGAAVLASHHSGKAQMRSDTNDQYSGRGGSSLSDNARSVMHMAKINPDANDAPANGTQQIKEGRLLRLSHVKTNYAAAAPDRYIERVQTPHAAQLCAFTPEFSRGDVAAVWKKLESWLTEQKEVRHPSARSLDALGKEFGSRSEIRRAVEWALDRGKLLEVPHPEPRGQRKTFYQVPVKADPAEAYLRATQGE